MKKTFLQYRHIWQMNTFTVERKTTDGPVYVAYRSVGKKRGEVK